MDRNFWAELPKPIFGLAPMANVTDAAFRQMFAIYGKPDVFMTEFVSVEGLCSSGRDRLLIDFWFSELEHPIVAQIFGTNPVQFEEVANLVHELGFDGIDINMGCPDKAVMKQGAGAALIQQPELAREIIRATKRGAHGLPVSVKTRLGYNINQFAKWLPHLFAEDLAAVTIHLRTRKEMSDVPAHWELAAQIAKLRDQLAPQTRILGNGDVETLAEARDKVVQTGIDGVMIGRGAFGKPWFFSEKMPSVTDRFAQLVEHADLFEQLFIPTYKHFDVMKKHFPAYASGFAGARDLRMQLMTTENAAQVRTLVAEWLRTPASS